MKRPEPFVPLSIRFATGKTGSRILESFGVEGLGVWGCFLAACKASRPQGEISFASEPEGWALLGLTGFEPQFTLEAFFTFTGRMKQTRRTRSGRVSYVVCTSWGDWNDAAKREAAKRRKSRSRPPSRRDIKRTSGVTESEPKRDLDIEIELEREEEANASSLAPSARRKRKPDDLWDAFIEEGAAAPLTSSERGKWNKGLKLIREADGTPDEAHRAIRAYVVRHKDMPLNPMAIANNWGALLNGGGAHLSAEQRRARAGDELQRRIAEHERAS